MQTSIIMCPQRYLNVLEKLLSSCSQQHLEVIGSIKYKYFHSSFEIYWLEMRWLRLCH